MDNQVIELKKKIRTLQKQLCDRTRNYLNHAKKSPIKKQTLTKQQPTQTDSSYHPLIEDMTQTQLHPDQPFANVNLDNFYQSSSDDGQSNRPQPKNTNPKMSLMLDLNTDQLNLDLEQQNKKHQEEIDTLALEIKTMKEQLESSKTPRNKHQMKFQFLQIPSVTYTPSKQVRSMEFLKKKQVETIEEQSNDKSYSQSTKNIIEWEHLSNKIKIMKKQIKKLKSLLDHEVQVSTYTKEALLISEEENYKFRLKIQRLSKEIQILTGASTDSDIQKYEGSGVFEAEDPVLTSIDSDKSESTKEQLERFKSQAQKYEEHIFILEGVKRDYLKKCIQAKENICKLKEQNQQLKGQINKLKGQKISIQLQDSLNEQISLREAETLGHKTLQGEIGQVFKSKIHEISNCLPIGENQEMFLFRPDTVQDLISMLERILGFCKNIQKWEKHKIQAVEKQRSNILRIVSAILLKHPEAKESLVEEILQIEQLKYLVNFLNKEPRLPKFSSHFLSFQYQLVQTKDNEPLQTA